MTFEGTEDCAVRDCDFIELGGNAVFINAYNRRATVEDCLIRNVGANGIALCGATETMRGDQFFKVLDETIMVKGIVRQKWEGQFHFPTAYRCLLVATNNTPLAATGVVKTPSRMRIRPITCNSLPASSTQNVFRPVPR